MAWGGAAALGHRGVTAGRKGWGWVQVSEQPLVPSCKEGQRNQWGTKQHEAGRSSSPTEHLYKQFNKTKTCLSAEIHQGELSRSNNMAGSPQPVHQYLHATGERCTPGKEVQQHEPSMGLGQEESGAVGVRVS